MTDESFDPPDDMMMKVATTVAALAAAFVAQRALAVGWRAITGHSAPKVNDNELPLAEIVTYTALSAAAIATARVIAGRRARQVIARRAQRAA